MRCRGTRRAVAAAALAALLAGAAGTPALAQTPPAPPVDGRPPITEDMLRRVGPPPRPNAELRIEVKPGTTATDERKSRQPKRKEGERRP
jgi:hypothetical protein